MTTITTVLDSPRIGRHSAELTMTAKQASELMAYAQAHFGSYTEPNGKTVARALPAMLAACWEHTFQRLLETSAAYAERIAATAPVKETISVRVLP